MDKEILIKTIQELCKENERLKKVNTLLTKGVEIIKKEATTISAVWERQHMVDVCESVLGITNLYSQKSEGKEVKIVESNY